MPFEDLERVYEALARAIDRMGPAAETLMLTRLALLMAERLGDATTVIGLIEDAVATARHDPPTAQAPIKAPT